MTKENRFEGLMGAVGKNKTARTSKHSDVQKSDIKKKPSLSSDVETSKLQNDSNSYTESQTEVHSAHSNIPTSEHSNISTSNQSNISTSKRSDVQTVRNSDLKSELTQHGAFRTSKKAKSVNPDYTRTTVYLPKKMHKKLKAIALDEEREMSSIVEELIENWLSERRLDV